jgi:hypothetical protein
MQRIRLRRAAESERETAREGAEVDTSRFGDRDSGFRVLDLSARFAFRSATSISFDLGRYSDTLRLPGGGPFGGDFVMNVGPGGVFKVTGRIDVHHPCEGHIKAQLLVVLPAEYHPFERVQEFVATIFEALGIPPDETFEALLVSPVQQMVYENATDREGRSDRMY